MDLERINFCFCCSYLRNHQNCGFKCYNPFRNRLEKIYGAFGIFNNAYQNVTKKGLFNILYLGLKLLNRYHV